MEEEEGFDPWDWQQSKHEDAIHIKISHRGNVTDVLFDPNSTALDLFNEISAVLDIPRENQKIFVPKMPLLKWPPPDPHLSLREMEGKKLMVMGTGEAECKAIRLMSNKLDRWDAMRAHQRALKREPASTKNRGSSSSDSAKYTFSEVRPLQNLPYPERSHALLLRLKADPGIMGAMRKHKFSVSLLTEMEPLSNTEVSHEGTSRTLGLNRNKGEVIELRLRTDAYDGYRHYSTIRSTLCHELAHNVHSDHDRAFWDLFHQIEKDVKKFDWTTVGYTLGESSRYHIMGHDKGDYEDHGGWTGGEYVLGGVRDNAAGLSRREILARAAMERQRKDDKSEKQADEGWRPCQRPPTGGNEQ